MIKDRLDQQASSSKRVPRRHRRDDQAGQPFEPELGASRHVPEPYARNKEENHQHQAHTSSTRQTLTPPAATDQERSAHKICDLRSARGMGARHLHTFRDGSRPGSIETARADSIDHRCQLARTSASGFSRLAQRPRCQSVPRGGPQKPHKPLRRKAHHWKPTDGTGLDSTRRHSGYDGGISLLTSHYAGELGCVILTTSWSQRGIEPLNGWTSPQMLRRYGASARSTRARRSYDRIMDAIT